MAVGSFDIGVQISLLLEKLAGSCESTEPVSSQDQSLGPRFKHMFWSGQTDCACLCVCGFLSLCVCVDVPVCLCVCVWVCVFASVCAQVVDMRKQSFSQHNQFPVYRS